MRKIAIKLLALLVCVFTCLAFVGCVDDELHEHEFGTDWKSDSANHWHECLSDDCDEISDQAAHTFDDGEITTEATCIATGVKTFTCTVCGYQKTEEIEKADHVADKTKWEKDGTNHWRTCLTAGCTEILDQAAHTFDDGEITTPATCLTEGVKTFTCTVCGYKKTEKIEKTAHVADTKWKTDEEYHWHNCATDGCKKHLDEAEHTWNTGMKIDDKWYIVCTVCEYKKEDVAFSYKILDDKLVFLGNGAYTVQCDGELLTASDDGTYDLIAFATAKDFTEATDVEFTLNRLDSDESVGESVTVEWTSPAVGGEINNFGSAKGQDAFRQANASNGTFGYEGLKDEKTSVVSIAFPGDNPWQEIKFGTPLCEAPSDGTYNYIVITMMFADTNAKRIALGVKGKDGELGSFALVNGWHEYKIPVSLVSYADFENFFLMPRVDFKGVDNVSGTVYVDGVRFEKFETTSDEAAINAFADVSGTVGTTKNNAGLSFIDEMTDAYGEKRTGVAVYVPNENEAWPNIYFGSPRMSKPADGAYDYIVVTMMYDDEDTSKLNAKTLIVGRSDVSGTLASFSIVTGWTEYWIPTAKVDYDGFNQLFLMPYNNDANITGKFYIDGIRFAKSKETVSGTDIINDFTNASAAIAAGFSFVESKADPNGVIKNGIAVFMVAEKDKQAWPNIKFGTVPETLNATEYDTVVFTMYVEGTNATNFVLGVSGIGGSYGSLNIEAGWHEYRIPIILTGNSEGNADANIIENFDKFFFMPQGNGGDIYGKFYIDGIRLEKSATENN